MFSVYAVRLEHGEKNRYFLNIYESLDKAKHLANCATLGNAAYAYVKDSTGGTVFYIEAVSPDELYGAGSIDPSRCRPVSTSAPDPTPGRLDQGGA